MHHLSEKISANTAVRVSTKMDHILSLILILGALFSDLTEAQKSPFIFKNHPSVTHPPVVCQALLDRILHLNFNHEVPTTGLPLIDLQQAQSVVDKLAAQNADLRAASESTPLGRNKAQQLARQIGNRTALHMSTLSPPSALDLLDAASTLEMLLSDLRQNQNPHQMFWVATVEGSERIQAELNLRKSHIQTLESQTRIQLRKWLPEYRTGNIMTVSMAALAQSIQLSVTAHFISVDAPILSMAFIAAEAYSLRWIKNQLVPILKQAGLFPVNRALGSKEEFNISSMAHIENMVKALATQDAGSSADPGRTSHLMIESQSVFLSELQINGIRACSTANPVPIKSLAFSCAQNRISLPDLIFAEPGLEDTVNQDDAIARQNREWSQAYFDYYDLLWMPKDGPPKLISIVHMQHPEEQGTDKNGPQP